MSILSNLIPFTRVTLDTVLNGEGCNLSMSCDNFSKLLQVKELQDQFDKSNAILERYYVTLRGDGDAVETRKELSWQLDRFSQTLDHVFVSMPEHVPNIAWTFQNSVNDFRFGLATKNAIEVGYFRAGMQVADRFLDALVDLEPFEKVEDSLVAAKVSFAEYSAAWTNSVTDPFTLQASQNRLTVNLVELQRSATKILSKISSNYVGDYQNYIASEDARLGVALDGSGGKYVDFLNKAVTVPAPYLADVAMPTLPSAFSQDLTQLGIGLDVLTAPATGDVAERDFSGLLNECSQDVIVKLSGNGDDLLVF